MSSADRSSRPVAPWEDATDLNDQILSRERESESYLHLQTSFLQGGERQESIVSPEESH